MIKKLQNRYLIAKHKLIVAYLKSTGEPEFKDRADYWPYVEIIPQSRGVYDVYYRSKLICKSSSYFDLIGSFRNVAIIGSGPSVKTMDFEKIREMDCVFLNGAVSLASQYDINPINCTIIDSTFIQNRFDIMQGIPSGSNLILTPGVIRAIAERDVSFLSRMNVYLTQNILRPIYVAGLECDAQREIARRSNFSFDIDCGFINGGTVMAVAIQYAHMMKAEAVYLVGLDISNASSPRFYETKRSKLKCGLADDYESQILPFMKSTAEVFKDSGVSIYNCSPISKLPYDIIPYNDIFAKNDNNRNSD